MIEKIKSIFIKSPKQILLRLLILISCYFVVIFIDRMTKSNIFTAAQFSGEDYTSRINWGIIGFMPLLNNGAAFSSLLGKYAFLQTMGLSMSIITALLIFIKVELKFLIPLILIGAGALGNVTDRFIYNGNVRDILYFPWWPRFAVFNFADSFIVVDSVTLLIILMVSVFQNTNSGTPKIA